MKLNFKKIGAVTAGLLMSGMTLGLASAASFPAPFVQNGAADVAIVYGSNLDMGASVSIQSALATYVSSTEGTTTTVGGESFKLEKASDKFNFGDNLDLIYPSLDDDEMEFLADGTYDDGEIDETFTQEIALGTHKLQLFHDEDVNSDAPTIGFKINDGVEILNYVMDFDGSDVNVSEMEDTELPLLGAKYSVTKADTASIELLDTAEKATLKLDESATIGGKNVKVTFIGTDEVKFVVDGETTDALKENEEFELEDGSYIIPTSIMTSSKDSVTDSVEFSIGSGKITLYADRGNVQLNDEDVEGLEASYALTGNIVDSITLYWMADGDMFLYEGEVLTMPLFENIKLTFGGLDFPSESEIIKMDNGATFTIDMGNYDFPLAWVNDTLIGDVHSGEEYHPLVLATEDITYLEAGYDGANATFVSENATSETWKITLRDTTTKEFVYTTWTNATSGADNETAADAAVLAETYLTDVLPLKDGERFVATKIAPDLTDVETMYYEVRKIDADDSSDPITVLELEDLINDNDLTFDDEKDSKDRGDITVVLKDFNVVEDTAYLSFTGATDYDKLVSDTGMLIKLPTVNELEAISDTQSKTLTFTEVNEDGDINGADAVSFTANIKLNGDKDTIYVESTNVTTLDNDDKVYVGYVESPLATKVTLDKTGDEYDFKVEYYGKEVPADVQVVAGGEVSTSEGTSTLGNVIVKDTEIDSVKNKNLIIVGGSCVNSAAANLLGGAYCGVDFTEATGVRAGEFLIKGVENAYGTGKLAIIVAGYETADTIDAATYLTKKDVDTTKTYRGTDSNNAQLVVM